MLTTRNKAAMAIGAGLGFYTSGGFDDPLLASINAGIGAATGMFMKLPTASLKEMSKVATAPSVPFSVIEKNLEKKVTTLSNFKEATILSIESLHLNINNLSKRIDKMSVNLDIEPRLTALEKRKAKIIENYDKWAERAIQKRLDRDQKEIKDFFKNRKKYTNKEYIERITYLQSEKRKTEIKNKIEEKHKEILPLLEKNKEKELTDIDVRVNWLKEDFSKALEMKPKIDKLQGYLDEHTKSLDNIIKIMQDKGYTSFELDDIKKFVEDLDNIDDVRQVRQEVKGSILDLSKVKADTTKVNHRIIESSDTEAIENYFKNVLNNPEDVAKEKAAMLSKRAEGPIDFMGGKARFTDSLDGKNVNLPLTSYSEKGIRYHDTGTGSFTKVTQFNPYARAYLDRGRVGEINVNGVMKQVDLQDVMRGMDPEMMLGLIPETTPYSSIKDKVNSLFHYDASGTAGDRLVAHGDKQLVDSTASFVNNNSIIELGHSLNFKANGAFNEENPFRLISSYSQDGMVSERTRLVSDLSSELPHNIFANVSNNALTAINTSDSYTPLATFAPQERGDSIVGNRGYKLLKTNANTEMLRAVLGDAFSKQFSSSQVLGKIDVLDAELFNKLAPVFTEANNIVLGEGAGLYNRKFGHELSTVEDSVLSLPMKNTQILSKDLKLALEAENVSEYFQKNPLDIDNSLLAISEDGEKVGLHKMYSSGQIVDATLSDGMLKLHVKAVSNPNVENNSKFFSTGTKSLNTGVGVKQFEALSVLALAINKGVIKENNGIITQELDGVVKNKIDMKLLYDRFKDEVKGVHLIGNASETGVNKIIQELADPSETPIYNLLKEHNPNLDKKTMAMTSLLFSEHKAATDLTTTLLVNHMNKAEIPLATAISNAKKAYIDNKQLLKKSPEFLELVKLGLKFNEGEKVTPEAIDLALNGWRSENSKAIKEIFNANNLLKATDKLAHVLEAYNYVEKSGIVESVEHGHMLAVGSFNKNQAIVGVGNTTRLSWSAINNLKSSGMSHEQLKFFGEFNDEIALEFRSILIENKKSTNSINSFIKPGEEHRALSVLNQTLEASDRLENLKVMFPEIGNKLDDNLFLSYNLAYEKDDIKSLNFSKIATNRSGKYQTHEGLQLLKDFEKLKLRVMAADIEYKNSTSLKSREVNEVRLKEAIVEYKDHVRNMTRGENSLLKEGLSLTSEHSSVMQVKAIGGEADTYFKEMLKNNEHVVFISEEEAKQKVAQLGKGYEIKLEAIPGTSSLKSVSYTVEVPDPHTPGSTIMNEVNLYGLMTREPAQGPLSTSLVSFVVDTSLSQEGSKGNVYTALSDIVYKYGMVGDHDQDTIQMLTGKFNSQAEADLILKDRQSILNTFKEFQPVLAGLSVKGNKKDVARTVLDFKSPEEYAQYINAGGNKGRIRKVLAAPATSLAVSYSKAMELAFTNGPTDTRLIQSRLLTHQLVENLIKTSHKDTFDFSKGELQAVEILSQARENFIGKGKERITATKYKEILSQHLPQFLGLDKLEGATKANVKDLIESMMDAEVGNANKVASDPFTPLDLNNKNTHQSWTDALISVLENSGHREMEYDNFIESPRNSAGQVMLGTSDIVTDVLKKNKSVILGGIAAMAGISILTRDDPDFNDSRHNVREHSASMLEASMQPQVGSQNDTPMGLETNSTKADYVTPKVYNKNIKVNGSFYRDEYQNPLNDFGGVGRSHDILQATFGSSIRSAKLELNM